MDFAYTKTEIKEEYKHLIFLSRISFEMKNSTVYTAIGEEFRLNKKKTNFFIRNICA